MVAAVGDFALASSVTGSPAVTASFTHDGIDLQAFLVQRRAVDSSDPWEQVAFVLPADVLVEDTEYAIPLVAEPGFSYRVVALDTDGTVNE